VRRKARHFGFAVANLVLGRASLALAQGEDPEKAPVPTSSDGGNVLTWQAWVQMILALALVVALIFLLRWVLKRFGMRPAPSGAAGELDVLQRRDLDSRHQLYLVRLGEEVLLIGAGPQGLRRLGELPACNEEPSSVSSDETEKTTSSSEPPTGGGR
jgi:flagellar biosynthetic protein FliO